MADVIERIGPEEAHDHLMSNGALLVCAYDSPDKFADNHLGGALSLDEFEMRADGLPRDTEVIFYCA